MPPRPRGPATPEINLTPLIDVVLVVLIIFMISIPLQIGEMRVKVPGPDRPPPPPEPVEQLVLAIYHPEAPHCDEAPCYGLNRGSIRVSALPEELSRRLASDPKRALFVDADTRVSLGEVVAAMDLAKAAGARRIGLSRLKPDGPRPPTSR